MHAKIARCKRKMYWKHFAKTNIFKLAFGEVLNRKGSRNGSGEGTEIQCDFSSIFAHFWVPISDQFWSKNDPKSGSKNECENESLKFGLGRSDAFQVDCE